MGLVQMLKYFNFSDRRTLGLDADVVAGGIVDLDVGASLDGQADLFPMAVRQPSHLRVVHSGLGPLHLVMALI